MEEMAYRAFGTIAAATLFALASPHGMLGAATWLASYVLLTLLVDHLAFGDGRLGLISYSLVDAFGEASLAMFVIELARSVP